jgi:hypothetical protein
MKNTNIFGSIFKSKFCEVSFIMRVVLCELYYASLIMRVLLCEFLIYTSLYYASFSYASFSYASFIMRV